MTYEYTCVTLPGEIGIKNQDSLAVKSFGPEDQWFCAVVVDGHDLSHGEEEFLSCELINQVIKAILEEQDLTLAFKSAQKALIQRYPVIFGGAVAGCVVGLDDHLVVAHCGDVRLYSNSRSGGGTYHRFTNDHTLNNPLEDQRLKPFFVSGRFEQVDAAIGFSRKSISRLHYRKNGRLSRCGLVTTRGFGDLEYQPALICEPEVRKIPLRGAVENATFALVSDGAYRNTGRTFASLQSTKASIGCFRSEFEKYHKRNGGQNELGENDDATAIFFRHA